MQMQQTAHDDEVLSAKSGGGINRIEGQSIYKLGGS